jgi:hypothetical protein
MLRSVLTIGAAFAAAWPVAAGVARADAAPVAVKTPDSKVVCVFSKKLRNVYCDWKAADDLAAEVRVRGAANVVASGGLIRPEGVPVLGRGESRRVGRLRCTSTRYGMRCVSLVTGNGFRVGPRIQPVLFKGLRRCGPRTTDGAGWFDVRSRHVACRRARRIARTVYRDGALPGWTCRERRLDLEHFRVRCSRGAKLVRFDHGA